MPKLIYTKVPKKKILIHFSPIKYFQYFVPKKFGRYSQGYSELLKILKRLSLLIAAEVFLIQISTKLLCVLYMGNVCVE